MTKVPDHIWLDWIAQLKRIEERATALRIILDHKLFNLRPDSSDRELTKILRDILMHIATEASALRSSLDEVEEREISDHMSEDDDGIELPF